MNYIKAKYPNSTRSYTYKTVDSVKVGDTVVTEKGAKLIAAGEVNMAWVEAYGADKLSIVKKYEEPVYKTENDRYIIERVFEHTGYTCVVTFGNMGHRCGYVGIPSNHPLFGKDYNDYLEIKKSDIGDREVSGILPLLGACLDEDERIRIEAYFNATAVLHMQAVESIQVIQSRVICGGSDLIAGMQEISRIWIMRCRSFRAIEKSINYENG